MTSYKENLTLSQGDQCDKLLCGVEEIRVCYIKWAILKGYAMNQSSLDRIVLEWSYTPTDYFEEPYIRNMGDYDLEVGNGRVTATIRPNVYEENPAIIDVIDQRLKDQFAGAQIVSHTPYTLSHYSIHKYHQNGRKDVEVFLHGHIMGTSTVSADVRVTDAEGNVTLDTRRDRIYERQRLAELAAKHKQSNPTASAILDSFDKSVRDPDNELVHLYDIRDALAKSLGGEKGVTEHIGISSGDWRLLGRLADGEPIRQGRHRGRFVGQLRDATPDELASARAVAKRMVQAYLDYLEQSQT